MERTGRSREVAFAVCTDTTSLHLSSTTTFIPLRYEYRVRHDGA